MSDMTLIVAGATPTSSMGYSSRQKRHGSITVDRGASLLAARAELRRSDSDAGPVTQLEILIQARDTRNS